MASSKGLGPILRSIIILGGVGVITTAATFAALQSPNAVLSSNTISTATAFLSVSNDGTTFNNTKTGFTFANVTPGGPAVPATGYNFYLKNTGTANLSIKVTMATAPTNINGIDLSKVFLDFSRTETGLSQNISIKSLLDSNATGGTPLNDVVSAGATGQYNIKVSMTSDAYSGGNGATISGVDLIFSGIGS
jgi:hypothetical protein